MQFFNQLWHEWRHGPSWHSITAKRPTRAVGTLIECECGKRWLSRLPWDRKAGF